MGRITRWAFLAVLGTTALAGSAYGAEDDSDLKTLLAECGVNVAASDIDSCLERARVMGEADPSPKLQTLTAKLERQAEQLEENEATPVTADNPAEVIQSGGGTPVTAGVSADKAAPHAEMH